VRRVPGELGAAREEGVAVLDGAQEPLPAGDDLQRAVSLLVELDRVGDRPRVADQRAALAQQLDDAGAGLLERQAGSSAGRVVAISRAPVASWPKRRRW